MRAISYFSAVLIMGACSAAQSVVDIETKLGAEPGLTSPAELAPGKRMLLRAFYSDKEITYDDRGTAFGAHRGSWLGDGYIQIKSAREQSGRLEIIATRLLGTFDKKGKLRFKDAKEKVVLSLTSRDSASRVFFAGNEELVATLPLLWRRYLTGIPAYPDQVSTFKPGEGVQAPRPTYTPAPTAEPGRAAYKAKYAGNVSLTCVVEADGTVHNVEIKNPVGSGLDERAAEAVSGWRFVSATRKKEPLAVRLLIDVDCHLY